MDIQIERLKDIVICTPKGEVNIHNSPSLRKTFNDLIHQDVKKVIVDFSLVLTIDTSGLATLIEMFHRLKKNQGQLRLSAMNDNIRKMFAVLKLCAFFTICPTREDAIRTL